MLIHQAVLLYCEFVRLSKDPRRRPEEYNSVSSNGNFHCSILRRVLARNLFVEAPGNITVEFMGFSSGPQHLLRGGRYGPGRQREPIFSRLRATLQNLLLCSPACQCVPRGSASAARGRGSRVPDAGLDTLVKQLAPMCPAGGMFTVTGSASPAPPRSCHSLSYEGMPRHPTLSSPVFVVNITSWF